MPRQKVIFFAQAEDCHNAQTSCRTSLAEACDFNGLPSAAMSHAHSIEDIIDEIASSRVTERGGRADDKRSETAMEDRKKAGYF